MDVWWLIILLYVCLGQTIVFYWPNPVVFYHQMLVFIVDLLYVLSGVCPRELGLR